MSPMHARDDQHLAVLLQQFSQATDRYVEFTGAQFGTHRTDMNALAIIVNFERSGTLPSAKDLSAELHLSAPATTAMLDRLARFGLIERERSTLDRRIVLIRPTTDARTMGKRMFGPLAKKMMEVSQNYSAQELELLARFLSEAIVGVDEAREEFVASSPRNSSVPTPRN